MPPSEKERKRLVDASVPLVRSIAAKIKEQVPREIEFEDLVAYGMQGLLEASERYDPRLGSAQFTTFAYYRVRGAMFDGLRTMGWLPRAEYARLRFEERADAYIQNTLDRDTGAARVQEGTTGPRLEEEMRQLADSLGGLAAIFIASLDARAESAQEGILAPQPHSEVETREQQSAIRTALGKLPEKERRLLEMFYFEDKSLAEAGAVLGLSKSWSSRLHARAIELLKEALGASDLSDGRQRAGKQRARR